MNTHRVPRIGRTKGISRRTAERLLDGSAGPGPEPLAQVIDAATAPASADELRGEDMAVAAFEMGHLMPASPSLTDQEHKSMLGKILTIKFLSAALAVSATGGVALAATSGAFTGSGTSVSQPSVAGATPSASSSLASAPPSPAPSRTALPSRTAAAPVPTGIAPRPPAAAPSPSASASATASAKPGLPRTLAGLCQALASAALPGSGDSNGGLLAGLSSAKVPALASGNSEFGPLVSAAGSAANVPDYCSLLLALPQLPDPAALAQLPATTLGALLSALPVSTLTQVLTQLPSSTLGAVFSALPASTLSSLLTSLPSSVLSQLFAELPASTVTSLLNTLPSSVLQQVESELPSSLLGVLGL